MEFWILFLVALGVLWAQWAVLSLVALGALRRRASEALQEVGAPLGRWLGEVGELARMAREGGVGEPRLAEVHEAVKGVQEAWASVAPRALDAGSLRRAVDARDRLEEALQALDLSVGGLPGVIEGWFAAQTALEGSQRAVATAIGRYNTQAGEYQARRERGMTRVVAFVFGYCPVDEWPQG